MDHAAIIRRLEPFPAALRALLASAADADARFKPSPRDWSILEVVNHLADEEAEDFRARLEHTLRDPRAAWPPLDLENVAERRGYNGRSLAESLDRFASERRESIAWLRALTQRPVDWSRAHQHPKFGPIAAGTLLASWAAHDALHLRQIARRLFGLAERDGAPECTSVGYAGEWAA